MHVASTGRYKRVGQRLIEKLPSQHDLLRVLFLDQCTCGRLSFADGPRYISCEPLGPFSAKGSTPIEFPKLAG